MIHSTSRQLSRFALSIALFLTAYCLSHAQAVITWGTPTFISGDADVVAVDTRIWAYNFGDVSKSPVVNGVTFTGYNSNTGNSHFTLTTVGSSIHQNTWAFAASNNDFNALSSNYQDLLRSATYWSGMTNHTQIMTLQDLTVGATYQIQFWVNDSRAGYHNSDIVTFFDTHGNTATLLYGTTIGQYVTGTFTAADTTQIINLGPYSPQINAATLGLVAVPEPATYAAIIGALALGLVVLRRRK